MIRHLWRCATVIGLLVGAIGCTPDFDEIWAVRDLRILAIRAEPPEVLLRSLPDVLPTVRIEMLAVDPRDPDRQLDWEVWACTPDDTYCDEPALQQRLHRAHTALDQIRYDFTPSPELFAASLETDPFRGFGGLPIIVELRLQDGEQTVSGFKRVVYTFPLPYSPVPDGKQANQNPELDRLEVDGTPVQDDQATVDGEGEAQLLPVPRDDAKERYLVVTSIDPNTGLPGLGEQELEEFLSYSFFTTAGKLSHATTGGRPSPFVENKKVTDVTSTWTTPLNDGGQPVDATLWVVIRDDRGGVSWKTIEAPVR